MSETSIQKKMATCRHFTGLFGPGMQKHETCAAGVRYDAVRISHEPIPYERDGVTYRASHSIPCLGGSHNLALATCRQCAPYTREEAEADAARVEREIVRMFAARKAITDVIEKGAGNHGVIACPECGKRLGYRRAESNGHIWARCETEGCVAWME